MNLRGTRFGALVVTRDLSEGIARIVGAKCDCGTELSVRASALRARVALLEQALAMRDALEYKVQTLREALERIASFGHTLECEMLAVPYEECTCWSVSWKDIARAALSAAPPAGAKEGA